ncbi:MAG TPA: hypothetical protein DGG95_16115, partial [Cytophagales bacterium]|nr:hypothetical protein [Cytophagales bacterium]
KERLDSITQVLDEIKNEMNLDFIFLNAVELEQCKSYFITNNKQTKELLSKVFNVNFTGNVAEREGMIIRQLISSILKEELEKVNSLLN